MHSIWRLVDAAPTAASAPEAEQAHCEATVLLVEDEELVRRLAKRALASAGYTVLEANNGTEALSVFERYGGKVDVLVTDMVMPAMSGPKLAQILRDRQSDLRVVYMSGYIGDLSQTHPMLSTGARFVEKPFTVKGLLASVHSVLDEEIA